MYNIFFTRELNLSLAILAHVQGLGSVHRRGLVATAHDSCLTAYDAVQRPLRSPPLPRN